MNNAAIILAIIDVLLRQGPQAVIQIASLFEMGNPSPDDIKKLYITKSPEEYFQ
jgi:hypothetical protein